MFAQSTSQLQESLRDMQARLDESLITFNDIVSHFEASVERLILDWPGEVP